MSDSTVFPDDPLGESRVWPVKIFTLGRFEVYRANEPLHCSGKVQRRPLSLLKAILAFGGQQVGEARLIDVLWPEAQGDVARFCLNSTVHRLRRLSAFATALSAKTIVSASMPATFGSMLGLSSACSSAPSNT